MFTTPGKYLLGAILGAVLVITSIFVLVDAYRDNDQFKLFVRGVLLIMWAVFAGTSWAKYRKATRSKEP